LDVHLKNTHMTVMRMNGEIVKKRESEVVFHFDLMVVF
jgi:hypothetical protein